MNRIRYLDENQREIDGEVFLSPIRQRVADPLRLNKLIHAFDFTGAPFVSQGAFNKTKIRFHKDVQNYLDVIVLQDQKRCYLRGRKYYLDVMIGDSKKLINTVVENILVLQELIQKIDYSALSLEEMILVLSLLDHKKHFSLIVLAGLYNHMLYDSDFPVTVYDKYEKVTKQDIENYYSFLLNGDLPELFKLDECYDSREI
jgi:hypothetical protein